MKRPFSSPTPALLPDYFGYHTANKRAQAPLTDFSGYRPAETSLLNLVNRFSRLSPGVARNATVASVQSAPSSAGASSPSLPR